MSRKAQEIKARVNDRLGKESGEKGEKTNKNENYVERLLRNAHY